MIIQSLRPLFFAGLLIIPALGVAQDPDQLKIKINTEIKLLEPEIISWRHYLHQHPELSNREILTAEFISQKLKSFGGIEVQKGIAHNGVVGTLIGKWPGPVIAFRADMDGLPVTERVDLEWKSIVKDTFNNQHVGVMHACGHDTHMAILLGTAEILSKIQKELHGTIKFIFQPAEEGTPVNEEGGAELMVKEGVLKNPDVSAIFGLHINSKTEVGKITYKPEAIMAAVNSFKIIVKGKQTHGSSPWDGIDPVVTSALIINSLQTIISRQTDLTLEPAVISVGSIHGGIRNNIIPEEVELLGTIRTLDYKMREKILEDIKRTVTHVAESQGATAEIFIDDGYPITYNDPVLTNRVLPILEEAAGKNNVSLRKAMTGAEDFSFYQQKIPGFFFFLGGMPSGTDPAKAPSHHTPDFYVDDSGMITGVRTFCYIATEYYKINQ